MRHSSAIILLTLILLPIIGNGISLLHFVAEHTHTFCQDETTHTHSNADECLTIYHLAQTHDQLPAPTKSEFQELKQYLTPTFSMFAAIPSFMQQHPFFNAHFKEALFFQSIFHPPTFA